MADIATRAARGTLLYAAAHGALTVSGFVTALLLARGLGPADYGVYGIVYSFLLAIELIGRFGIPQAVSRLVAETGGSARALEATGVTLTAVVYAAIFVAFLLAAPLVAALFEVPDGAFLFRVAALDIPFYGLFFVVSHILNGRRDFAGECSAIVVYAVARTIGIAILCAGTPTVAGALLVNAVSSALALAVASRRVGVAVFRPRLLDRSTILRLALPIAVATTGNLLVASIDLWALNAFGDAVPRTVKGVYTAAVTLARMPNLLAFVMSAVLLPSVARAIGMGDAATAQRAVRGALRFMAILLLPTVLLVAVESGPLLDLMFSEAYGDGAALLTVLVFAHGLGGTLLATMTIVLIAAGSERGSAVVALAASGVALVVDGLAAHLFGAAGAAWGALVTTAGALAATAMIAGLRIGGLIEPGVVLRVLLAAVAVASAAALIPSRGAGLLVELGGLAVVYLGLLWPLGVLRREDLGVVLPGRAPVAGR